jgi:hypothetical protein
VDRTKGKYRNFGRLVLDFGGWSCKEAIEGACTAMSKCMMMGPPWVHVHPQSGLTEYLVLEMDFEEEFTSMWSEFTETWQGAPASSDSGHSALPTHIVADKHSMIFGGDAGDVDGARAAAAPKPGKGAPEGAAPKPDKGAPSAEKAKPGKGAPDVATPNAKKQGGKVKNSDEVNESPDAEKKQQFAKLMREAMKLKQVFHTASSNFVQVITAIDTDSKWSWAKGGPQEARLRDMKAKLQTELNPWHEEFLVTADFVVLKRKYSTERIVVELSKFMQIKAMVESLAKTIGNTNNAHSELMDT